MTDTEDTNCITDIPLIRYQNRRETDVYITGASVLEKKILNPHIKITKREADIQ